MEPVLRVQSDLMFESAIDILSTSPTFFIYKNS